MSNKIVLTQEKLLKIRELYKLGYSKLKIVRELNIGKDVLNRAFIEWDIPNNLNTKDIVVEITKYYIYIIQNKTNHKIYVGQTKNLKKRWRSHRNIALYSDENKPIYNSLRKHGIENFTFQDIEEFDNLDDCNDAEEFWIQYFQSTNKELGYNIALGGNNHEHTQETKDKLSRIKSGTKVSEETKKKMSIAHQGERNGMFGKTHSDKVKKFISDNNKGKYDGENNPFYGKHHTEETKKILSENHKGLQVGENNPMFGKTHTPETRRKISEAAKNRKSKACK